MAKIQPVWAIDVGQAALKALKLVPGESPEQAVAEAFDYVEYPKILSQPDADPEELVRDALTTFLGRNDLKGCKVALSVPGQAGLVKFIKLPPVEKKRIPDIVKFEARQQIPFALEEVIWDYQQIGADEKDKKDEEGDDAFTMAEVGLFAMKRDQINRAIQPLKNAGIEIDIVQMGPLALYNYASFDLPREEGGSVVLLDVGADNTDLIITDGTRIWQRNVPIGGNHFTRALTKELKLTFAKAEHLKRNATKAPDPRAVFTAMRGVFNDFSSEVSRSIGFYSSVNRTAKIVKVTGLGNGFKLPGLQKFLQQNLSYEVDKLEAFHNLTGDEVLAAPQFQENVMSFCVAYGLAVQALGRGRLRTNLLPPEIEQVRMIRRKKPWALVASALLMIGFAALFLGALRALAKVDNADFTSAVSQAKAATSRGTQYKTDFDTAKSQFTAKVEEGKGLVGEASPGAGWPKFFQVLNQALPNPAKQMRARGLDPTSPANELLIARQRVHIDAVKPVWRENLADEWFNTELKDFAKSLMLPLDRETPPTGKGWVIQVIGHHYNPSPYTAGLKPAEKNIALGPVPYLVTEVIPLFYRPELRAYGIHHVALAWAEPDYKWTSEKGATQRVPSAPLLSRAVASLDSNMNMGSGGVPGAMGSAGQGGAGRMGSMGSQGSGPMGAMGSSGSGGSMGSMVLGARGGMGAYSGTGMGGAAADATKEHKADYLTRTDFLIQFAWTPPEPGAPPPDQAALEKIQKDVEASVKKLAGAINPKTIEEAVTKGSDQLLKEKIQQELNPTKPAPAATGKAAAAATAPAANSAAPAAPTGPAAAPTPAPAGTAPPTAPPPSAPPTPPATKP
jgi:type IV pilus assembly protein PilM